MRLRAKEKGFTLIELLVVVVIIGILAAVALPKLFSAICSSKIGAVEGVMSGLNSALTLYFGDNEGKFYSSTSSINLLDQTWFTPKYYNKPSSEDPWNSPTPERYVYMSNGSEYTICFENNAANGCGPTGDKKTSLFSTQTGKISNTATACP